MNTRGVRFTHIRRSRLYETSRDLLVSGRTRSHHVASVRGMNLVLRQRWNQGTYDVTFEANDVESSPRRL